MKNKIKGSKLNFIIPMVCGGVFLMFLPFRFGPFYSHVFILMFIHIVLASSLRILFLSGRASLGQAAFVAIGGYTSGLLTVKLGLPFGVCFLAAGIMAALAATALGRVALGAPGAYFFMITLAFWAVIDAIIRQWEGLTGGYLGFHHIPPILGFTDITPNYFIIMAFTALTVFIMYRLDRSKFGREILAIGDSSDLAEMIGINVLRHRVVAWTIGAAFSGFAGSLQAHYMTSISPMSYPIFLNIYIIIWCTLGGVQKVWGPIAGASLLTLLAELLRMSGVLQALLYATVLLIAIMMMPHGITGLVDTWRARASRHQYIGGGAKSRTRPKFPVIK